MLIVYTITSLTFLAFKSFTLSSSIPSDPLVISTPDGIYLNRAANDYPYKTHLQPLRALYAIIGCTLLLIFNGWRSFLNPFSHADFLAAYMAIPIFLCIVVGYHVKDEREWRVWMWKGRRTMDIGNPVATREKDPEKRKGRLRRVDGEQVWTQGNVREFFGWVWVWLK
jgi:amino acid transporter